MKEAEEFTHPAQGMISISRTYGKHRPLFGTNLSFNNQIEIELKTCTFKKAYHKNWYHADKHLFKIEMSPVQFAELFTSMNNGDGVPCTIRYAEGKLIEDPPSHNRVQDVKDDFRNSLNEIGTKFTAARKRMAELLEKNALGKADRAELTSIMQQIEQHVMRNLPFVEESFKEAVEETTLEAKAEIEAHMSLVKTHIGEKALEALNSGEPLTFSFGTDLKIEK